MAKKRPPGARRAGPTKRLIPAGDGLVSIGGRQEFDQWLDEALNDPDIAFVGVSGVLFDEMVADRVRVDLVALDEVPGRVLVAYYNRTESNLRMFPLDQVGSDWVLSFLQKPDYSVVMPWRGSETWPLTGRN